MRVLAEELVPDRRVVGEGQDLMVRALHVIRLVEGVDRGFPVRRQHRGEHRPQPHLFKVIRREEFGKWREEVEQGLGVRIEVQEHEPAPGVRADRGDAQVGGEVREVAGVGHLDAFAVEGIAPRVERAPEAAVGHVAGAGREARAAMEAHVVEGVDRAVVVAGHDGRLRADVVDDVVAGLGKFLFPARDLPDAGPHAFEFEREEVVGQVARLRDEPVVVREPLKWQRGDVSHGFGM